MTYLIILLLLTGVVWLVSEPLRRGRPAAAAQDVLSMQRVDLEAARDAKLREIRDAELDHQTGKLSDADYMAVDSTLRAEAVELLHQLDALELSEGTPGAGVAVAAHGIGERHAHDEAGSGARLGEAGPAGIGEDAGRAGIGEDAGHAGIGEDAGPAGK